MKVIFVCDGEICGNVGNRDFQLYNGNTLLHAPKGDTWINCDDMISGNIRIMLSCDLPRLSSVRTQITR